MKRFLIFLIALPLWAQSDEAWRMMVRNDYQAAREAYKAAGLDDDWNRIGWFLTHTGQGPTPALLEAAVEVLRLAPEAPSAEFVLRWMESERDCFNDWLTRSGAIIDAHRPQNPELRDLYARNFRARARMGRTPPDFQRLSSAAGFVTNWRFTTRQGAYPLPAFETSWPPEEGEGWDQAIEHASRTGVIIPPRAARGSGVIYAHSEFENPADQPVRLRLFSYQNVALFINGQEVARHRHLEQIGSRVNYHEIDLPAGRHHILIKTSQTRENNGQFSLQLSADQDLRLLKPTQTPPPVTDPFVDVRRPKVGLAALADASDSQLASFVEAYLAMEIKDVEMAVILLEPMQGRSPESQLLGGILARIYLDEVRFRPQEAMIGAAFQILSTLVRQQHPHGIENAAALGSLLYRARQTQQSLDLFNQVLAINPQYCDALEFRLEVAVRQDLIDLRRESLDMLASFGPEHRWAQKELLEHARDEGDLVQTSALLDNLSAMLPWDGYVSQKHEMAEDYAAAVNDLERRWEIFKNQDYYPYAISQAYAKTGDHNTQRDWLEKTLGVNPTNRNAILDLVNLDALEGNRQAAIDRVRDYLQREPADGAFRQRLSHLEGATAFEAFRVDAMTVIEEAKNKPISEGADSELLLDQLMVRLFPDGSQMRYTHLVTRVLTKEGVDNESELSLPEGAEILELRTIKADGSILYPESFENKNTLSLSGVSIGDFTQQEFIEYLPPAFYDQNGVNADMTFIFQGVDRIYHQSELVLIYPETLDPEPVLMERNMPSEVQTEVVDGFKYVRWRTVDKPPIKVEPDMPPLGMVQPTASFYYNTNWNEIRNFYHNAIFQRLGMATPLKQSTELWRQISDDPREVAEQVYRQVTDRIEPSSQLYRNINHVWETGEGNATLLLLSVYRELGLDVDIVLTRSAKFDDYIFTIPYPSFSYLLLRLTLDDEEIWVDANHQNLRFGYIPFAYQGATAILIDDSDDVLLKVPRYNDDEERSSQSYSLVFNADGSALGDGSERFFGLFSSQLRGRYESLNRPEIRQRVEVGLNNTFSGAVVSSVTIPEDTPNGEFELTHQFSLARLGDWEADRAEFNFPLPNTPLLDRYGQLANRETALDLASAPSYGVSELTLTLPEGWRWSTEADLIETTSRFGEYALEIDRPDDQTLRLKRRYQLPAQYVQPQDYQDFLVFCKTMLENENLKFEAIKDTAAP